jgi:hypothetical protein
MNMINVTFSNPSEIRMGSPFNIATLQLDGKWTPQLPEEAWQDITAQSPDGHYVGLVAWRINFLNNPGFRIYSINTQTKSFSKTRRIRGCCQSIEWDDNLKRFGWKRFLPE